MSLLYRASLPQPPSPHPSVCLLAPNTPPSPPSLHAILRYPVISSSVLSHLSSVRRACTAPIYRFVFRSPLTLISTIVEILVQQLLVDTGSL